MIINWANVRDKINERLAILPDKDSIDTAIRQIEERYDEDELFEMEANDLEKLLIAELMAVLMRERKKDIKKMINLRNKLRKQSLRNERERGTARIQIFGLDDFDDVFDEDILDEISRSVIDDLMGKKKKKDDDDDDKDVGASFYL